MILIEENGRFLAFIYIGSLWEENLGTLGMIIHGAERETFIWKYEYMRSRFAPMQIAASLYRLCKTMKWTSPMLETISIKLHTLLWFLLCRHDSEDSLFPSSFLSLVFFPSFVGWDEIFCMVIEALQVKKKSF